MTPPAAVVAEVRAPGDLPLWVHPGWEERFPWLVQGITGAGEDGSPFDLGLSGSQPVGPALERWRAVQHATGGRTVVHARQVHGAELQLHQEGGAPGILVMSGVDGHLSAAPGVVLSVSVADCVPVSVVDPERRAVALLHAGWRGVAAGILERALERMQDAWGTMTGEVWVHCGPAICAACYPVGPEVHRAVRPTREPPGESAPIDLRADLAERAAAAGVDPGRISVSAHCTRCGGGGESGRAFFSHRAGDAGRQMALLGVRG